MAAVPDVIIIDDDEDDDEPVTCKVEAEVIDLCEEDSCIFDSKPVVCSQDSKEDSITPVKTEPEYRNKDIAALESSEMNMSLKISPQKLQNLRHRVKGLNLSLGGKNISNVKADHIFPGPHNSQQSAVTSTGAADDFLFGRFTIEDFEFDEEEDEPLPLGLNTDAKPLFETSSLPPPTRKLCFTEVSSEDCNSHVASPTDSTKLGDVCLNSLDIDSRKKQTLHFDSPDVNSRKQENLFMDSPECNSTKKHNLHLESPDPNSTKKACMNIKKDPHLLPFTTPYHILPAKEKSNGPPQRPCEFSSVHVNSLESLSDEGFLKSYLEQLRKFTGQSLMPTVECLLFITKEILLDSKSKSLSLLAYGTLKQIHTMFPVHTRKIFSPRPNERSVDNGLTWLFLADVVDRMEISGCQHKESDSSQFCLKSFNATLVFLFMLSVLEEEEEKHCPGGKRTMSSKLFSPQLASSNFDDILYWLKCAASSSHQATSCVGPSYHNGTSYQGDSEGELSSTLPCALLSMQRLLHLSFLVSDEDGSDTVANELLYAYTHLAVERRSTFLQTIRSHALRKRLIFLIFEDCCKNTGTSEDLGESLCLRKIVNFLFSKLPLRHHSSVEEGSFYSRTPEEYEEFVMLLMYLMQSYIHTMHPNMQGFRRTDSDETEETVDCQLSLDDKDCLVDIVEVVNRFTNELFEKVDCPTEKTFFYLELINTFKVFSF